VLERKIFAMGAENVDLVVVISLLEGKRAALDSAITALRAVVDSGAMDGAVPTTAMPFAASGSGGEVPDGAFNGMSMPAAIKLFLEIVRSKKTAREISDGLKKGGFESTSKFFDKIVYSTLMRLRGGGDVIKIGDAWGLPAWYPALLRAAKGKPAARAKKPVSKGKGHKQVTEGPKLLAVTNEAKTQRPKLKSEPGPSDMIDWFLRDNPGPHTAEEIGTATKIANLNVARMVLGTMIKRGKVARTEDGKYRKAS
jgi:hypothetical protein